MASKAPHVARSQLVANKVTWGGGDTYARRGGTNMKGSGNLALLAHPLAAERLEVHGYAYVAREPVSCRASQVQPSTLELFHAPPCTDCSPA